MLLENSLAMAVQAVHAPAPHVIQIPFIDHMHPFQDLRLVGLGIARWPSRTFPTPCTIRNTHETVVRNLAQRVKLRGLVSLAVVLTAFVSYDCTALPPQVFLS